MRRRRVVEQFDPAALVQTKPAAAHAVGCGTSKIQELMKNGTLEVVRYPGSSIVRITTASILKFISESISPPSATKVPQSLGNSIERAAPNLTKAVKEGRVRVTMCASPEQIAEAQRRRQP